jgi:ferredoxin-thioredoxin reductase catalytic subunit
VFEEISPDRINYEFFKESWQKQVDWMNATLYQDKIMLNPKEDVLKDLAQTMGEFLLSEKRGQAYCPCRILSPNSAANRKIICPCYFYMGEIEMMGRCHCSLFVKEGFIPGLENPNG